ncbi:hypothetical protein PIB30_014718 [Stylosanthes scabra]|uniref:Uncharacterized protein n=1 Tax=Stylosanthes scabra TaxID=79078 RepID=A0ABU6W6D2_9FABA|nr:hypothetical protein [Stylosanthes scabra]
MEGSVEKKKISEEDPKGEKEDPEEEVPASSSLPMDIDDTEDYWHFIEESERRPEYSPILPCPSLGDRCKVRPGVHGHSLAVVHHGENRDVPQPMSSWPA